MRRAATTPQRTLSALIAAALFVSQLALPPRAEASHLGSSTASAGSAPPPGVSAVQSFQPDLFTGRATTGVPIAVPPGRKGMQPSLGLSYSSSGRNGWVGVGWGLDVGYLERSTKTGVPRYDSSDTYTFMFQGVSSDLVRIPDGTYRAKDEGLFLRVESLGPSGWEVRDKSGTRYLFGQTAASQIESGGQVFRWCLDKVIDLNGNSLTISYTKDQGQLYLSQIRYTAHEPTALAPANQVDFIVEDRPDDEVSYRSGFPITVAKRLKTIETKATVGATLSLARRYQLAYTTSGRTGRSLLASVTQVGSDGLMSLPPVTFTYQDTGSASYPTILNNFQSLPSVAAWNVRKANLDTGHETWGCAHPYMGLPWGSPSVASGGFNLGCVSGSVSGTGDVTMNGCNDTFGHVWTYVYVNTPRTLSVSVTNGSDAVGCLYREDASGVSAPITGGSISLQAGWSILHITAYHQHQGWGPTTLSGSIKSQVDVMNPSPIPLGVPQLAGDVNGDAKTDLIKFNPSTGSWSVSCATSCTLPPGGSWLSGFGNSSSTPLLGDWNGDGKTDVATFTGGNWQFATSTGTSFQPGTVSSFSSSNGTPLIGDFNGDGNTDLGTYNNGAWSIALGTGSGFSSAGSFTLSWGDGNFEASTGDFNGDGLTDIGIVNKSSGAMDVRLSTGSGWTGPTNWVGSFGGANPHTSADFNGDGLTDAAYYNRSAGQVIYAPSTGSTFGSPVTLPLTFSLTSSDDTIQVGDFNGDSIVDPAVFNLLSGSSQLALSSLTNPDGSNGTATDVLRTITNGMGGTTTITYQPSTLCGCDQTPLLPFVIQVVQRVTTSDGLGNSYTTTYLFHDGLYDAATKEFRGFEQATAFDVQGNKSITHFHQDTHKKGRPFRTEFRDQYDTLWTKAEQTWSCIEPFPGVHFTKLDQTDGFTYDGDATFRQTRSRFTYDSVGNLIRADEDGEVGVAGDERAAVTQFVANTTAWILGTPSLTQTLDATGVVVAQRRFYYDGAATIDTAPTQGRLTKEEEWRTLPTEQWVATTLTYDATGNVKTVQDALNRTTTNTYDATGTYLITITNTLGHTRQLAYDPRLGAVTTSTDQNTVASTTVYDALGRITTVIGPTDTVALPTVAYEYDLSTVPAKTVAHARMQSGQAAVLTTTMFTDGLGRTIQTRAPAEDSTKQVVGGAVELNPRGQVVRQWVPYLDQVSATYRSHTLVAGLASPVTYTYDPAGRLLTTTDPDGSISSTSYDDWVVTSTDATGSRTRRTADASGRLIKVEEFNGTEVYATVYQYDALGNLTTVTDAQGHLTRITYDSLGRKLSMNDPDMGRWTYAYDAVDNLTSQIDARGVTISFSYDALNRLTQKSYAVPPASGILNPGSVTYTYDDPAKPFSTGKLTSITDGSGSSSFEYDTLGRLTKEFKTIDGTTSTIQRSYDLLGRLTALTYPDTDIASYTYNSQGGLETVDLSSSITQSLNHLITGIDYNAAGQLTKLIYGNGTVSDYTYNPLTLRLDQLKTTGPTGTLQDFSYAFDPVGNVTGITDRVHTGTQTFAYDPLHRLTQAIGSYGTQTYAYDPIGNMLSKEGATMRYGLADGSKPHAVTSSTAVGSTAVSLTYDVNGNLLSKGSTDSLAHVLTPSLYSYDAENRLVEVKAPSTETVAVTFQPGWNFFSLPVMPEDASVSTLFPTFAQNFEQLAKFEPTTNTFKHYVGNSKFDDFSSLDYGVGYQVYCKASAPVTIAFTGKLPSAPLTKSLNIGWHLLPAISLQPAALSLIFSGVDYDQLKAYDTATSSLTTPTDAQPGKSYWVHIRTASTFSPAFPRDPTTRFVYDGDGGRVKQITAAGTTTFLGEVVEKAPDGKTTKYVFAGSQRIASIDRTPQQQAALREPKRWWAKAWTSLLAFLDIPVAEAAGVPTIRFYHTDHLGSSNVITDATGAVVELAEYTPYGSLTHHEGSTSVPQQFTGQRLDASTGLYYYHARYYDPDLGRFIQADPIVPVPGDPQALNRYSYVRNNPVNFVDPSGYKWSWKKFFGIVAIVAVAVTGVGLLGELAAGSAVAATAFGTSAFGEAFLAASPAIAGWGALAGTASGIGFALTPGSASSGFAATVGAATAVGGTVLGAGALAPGAVLGAAALQGGVTYAGMRLLDTPLAQEGIGRAAGALERIGLSQRAAVLLASVVAGTVVFGALSSVAQASLLSGATGAVERTEIVQRAMSRAELEATRDGLLRGGRDGTHYVSDAVNSNANRARMRLSLRQTPEVRVTLEVPEGRFSAPSPVDAMYGMPGGGMERTATGKIPVKILRVDEY